MEKIWTDLRTFLQGKMDFCYSKKNQLVKVLLDLKYDYPGLLAEIHMRQDPVEEKPHSLKKSVPVQMAFALVWSNQEGQEAETHDGLECGHLRQKTFQLVWLNQKVHNFGPHADDLQRVCPGQMTLPLDWLHQEVLEVGPHADLQRVCPIQMTLDWLHQEFPDFGLHADLQMTLMGHPSDLHVNHLQVFVGYCGPVLSQVCLVLEFGTRCSPALDGHHGVDLLRCSCNWSR